MFTFKHLQTCAYAKFKVFSLFLIDCLLLAGKFNFAILYSLVSSFQLSAMKRYYQAMLQNDIPPGQSENVNYVSEASVQNCQQIREEVDVDKLPIDPAKRKSIYDSHVNDREKIRRFYLQKGPCQPKIEFPRRIFGEKKRRFVVTWKRSVVI
ncbi:hypothetical protein POM88_053165 [Heracleum sosnowskyi]|uniref:Uncharacterized protein n=1 Tax=Heracleum sosnowskyi TaxID=360622 RepID=A0AAD8GQP7_9APIA|nr:hypothetical protein POM88_053165 [Heracleum sosnowskyi]